MPQSKVSESLFRQSELVIRLFAFSPRLLRFLYQVPGLAQLVSLERLDALREEPNLGVDCRLEFFSKLRPYFFCLFKSRLNNIDDRAFSFLSLFLLFLFSDGVATS